MAAVFVVVRLHFLQLSFIVTGAGTLLPPKAVRVPLTWDQAVHCHFQRMKIVKSEGKSKVEP